MGKKKFPTPCCKKNRIYSSQPVRLDCMRY